MKRVLLFLITNFAIMIVLSITMRLLGVGSMLDAEGVHMNLNAIVIYAAVFGMGGSFISLAMSKWSAKRMTGARVIEQPTSEVETWLVQRVSQHAKAAGIGMPEVAIFDSRAPNAFATGARRDSALVAVSTGLMQSMTRDEVDAVLGHEICHVANGDMVTLALIQGVVNTFVIVLSRVVGHFVDRVVFKTERGYGPAYYVAVIVAQMVIGILASAVVYWFSRQREFRADAGAARLCGPQKMIAALERLKGGVEEPLPDQVAAFGISGGKGEGIRKWFTTHPSLDERIEALRRFGG